MSRTWRRVAILGHSARPGVRRAAARLRDMLRRRGMTVRLDARLAAELGVEGMPLKPLARWSQLFITLGGDGTALAARDHARWARIGLIVWGGLLAVAVISIIVWRRQQLAPRRRRR